MNLTTRLASFLPLCVLISAAETAAQTPHLPVSAPNEPAAARTLTECLRVPIHTQPDDPAFGRYGLWAAGPDYKASFHDGFAFYPCLGTDYPENLPLVWRTESIVAGAEVLVTPATATSTRSSDWRHEIHYPGVMEAYDVRADGVEQTFRLDVPPTRGGDWVVTGRIATRLLAPALVAAAHQELVFTDATDRPLVRYGAATAIDAAGERHAATTSFDGERIRLTVDGAWLATAKFPVVLDPLSSAVQVYPSGTQGAADLDIASTNDTDSRVMVVFTRAVSAADRDAYALLTTPAFAAGTVVYSDLSTSWSAEKTSVGYSAFGGWVVAFQRATATSTQIRAWVNDRTSQSGGSLVFPQLPVAGTCNRNPDVGAGGTSVALIVFQSDVTASNANTANTEVYGMILDTLTLTFDAPFLVPNQAAGTRYDRENPTVNQIRQFGPSIAWVVAWQELDRNVAGDDWDIWAQRVTSTGSRTATADLTAGVAAASNKVRPQIDGDAGRFMVAYLLASSGDATAGPEIRTVRFEAPDNVFSISGLVHGVLQASTMREFSNLTIAHDRVTDSHWAIGYESRATTSPGTVPAAHLDRVGYTGGVVEATTLVSNTLGGFSPAVTNQLTTTQETNRFLVVYAAPAGLGRNIEGRSLNYAASAATRYGTGCGTGSIASTAPRAGSERFAVALTSAPAFATSVLLLSDGMGTIPLDGSGMTGCVFNLSPGFFMAFVSATDGSGYTDLVSPLPDRPAFFGDLYFQWIYVSFGANPAGLQATRGLRAQVR
jgi:hypothetical protein